MKTLYLIAGPNGAGKSTLAQTLLNEKQLVLSHNENALVELQTYLTSLITRNTVTPDISTQDKSTEDGSKDTILYLDGDKLTKAMQLTYPENKDIASLMPAFFDQLIDTIFEQGVSLAMESNFYSPSIIEKVDKAKQMGYRVELVYIALRSADLALERVKIRAARGGLAVSNTEILKRFEGGIRMVNTYYGIFDRFILWENVSAQLPVRISEYTNTEKIYQVSPTQKWLTDMFKFL